ncbi:hypothetical protein Tco_0021460 [Tanacetum coccineum]
MKGRVWSWMELVLALQVKDNQFSMDGLSEFFPHPFRIIDMSSIDDAQRNCNTGALGLSNPEVFLVRHRLMIVMSALYG